MPSFFTVTNPQKKFTIKPIVVVLAPGMGGDRKSPGLVAAAKALSNVGVMTVIFDFPYRIAGKKSPDSPRVLEETYRAAIEIAVAKCAQKCGTSTKKIDVYIGGRSMGARIASEIAAVQGSNTFDVQISKTRSVKAAITGCIFLSYPLHAPGKKERKDKHFSKIAQKTIFVSGTRDAFGTPQELASSAKKIKGKSTCVFLDGGDHELKTLKSADVTYEELNKQLGFNIASFVS